MKLYSLKTELDASRIATGCEIDYTIRLIEGISKKESNKLTDKELILYSIYSVMKDIGIDVNFTQNKLDDDASLQLQSRCFVATLADINFYETKLKTAEFIDRLFVDDYLEAFFVEVFREFIARQFDVDKEKIVVLDVSRESVAVFWCSFASASLNIKTDLSQDGDKHLEYCGLTLKKPLVTSLLINENFFDSKCIFERLLSVSWRKFKMNAEFGFEKDKKVFFDDKMEENQYVVCLGMKWKELKLVEILNDQPNLVSIVCFRTIETAEEYVEACSNNFKLSKILIRCRLNPNNLQTFEDNLAVVNSFDDLMPVEILIKKLTMVLSNMYLGN